MKRYIFITIILSVFAFCSDQSSNFTNKTYTLINKTSKDIETRLFTIKKGEQKNIRHKTSTREFLKIKYTVEENGTIWTISNKKKQ